ncbi:MAG: DUF948 domain-containing protein [Patescibacteria group bacterium]|nr:DUF948 domain-containing protein [Patescibacteria group bacterium]
MLETSKDILNVSIAGAVIVLVIFLCFALYYLIANLKRINRISGQVEKGVTKIDNLVDLIKNKVNQSSSYLFLFGKLAEKAMSYFISKKDKKNEEESPKNSKKNYKRK